MSHVEQRIRVPYHVRVIGSDDKCHQNLKVRYVANVIVVNKTRNFVNLTWTIPLCLFSSFAPRKRAVIKRYTTYPFINSDTQF